MSVSVVVREVTDPSEVELNAWAKLLAEAFDYQFFGSGLGGDKSLQEPILRAHMTAALINHEGEIHVAELPEIGVVGVAVWFGPGHKFLQTEAQRKAGWDQVIEHLAPQYQEWWKTLLDDYDALAERALGAGIKLGGYHLQLIGVAPTQQKKGIATELMRYAEGKAHAALVPSVLETMGATNCQIYQSLGYQIAGSGPLKSAPPSQGTSEMFVFIKHTESDASVV